MSAYVQQQQLLKRYQSLVCIPDIEALMAELWGPKLTDKQMYGTPNAEGFLDRIDEHVPELIMLMDAPALQAAADLLNGTLAGFIRHVLAQGHSLKQRDKDPRLRKYKADPALADWETDPSHYHNDDARCRLIGLDTLHKANYQTALSGARLTSHNARREREGLAPIEVCQELSARQLRRRREKARAAERATPAPAPPPPPPVAPKPQPAPKQPVVVLVPLAHVFPKPTPKTTRRQWQPWHGQQLALWSDAAPAGAY